VTRWELWISRGSSSRMSLWVKLFRAKLDLSTIQKPNGFPGVPGVKEVLGSQRIFTSRL